jgi:hypothetical protein
MSENGFPEGAAYDFSGLTVLDLVRMRRQVGESPWAEEDKEFLDAVMAEIGKRHREALGMVPRLSVVTLDSGQ